MCDLIHLQRDVSSGQATDLWVGSFESSNGDFDGHVKTLVVKVSKISEQSNEWANTGFVQNEVVELLPSDSTEFSWLRKEVLANHDDTSSLKNYV